VTELHGGIAVLAPLIGTWSGTGSGEYPTIQPFDYVEEIAFSHTGRPFLTYTQRTRAADDGRPLHAETGYLRAPSPNRIEWILAHPTGVTEIQQGPLTVSGDVVEMDLLSSAIGLTASAKEIVALARHIRIDGDDLTYELRMAAVGHPLRHHLSARLRRQRR
jgi:THAP4-like, heme-binding beta-barrel domain